jgi:hypothetical protein
VCSSKLWYAHITKLFAETLRSNKRVVKKNKANMLMATTGGPNMQPQMQPPVADPNDHPDVPILPPFIYLGFFFLALLLDFILPIDVFAWGLQFFLGMMLLSAGIGVMTF